MSKDHFVYRIRNNQGHTVYVGKSSKGQRREKVSRISEEDFYSFDVLEHNLDEKEAYKREKHWIMWYRPYGHLLNKNGGGSGGHTKNK